MKSSLGSWVEGCVAEDTIMRNILESRCSFGQRVSDAESWEPEKSASDVWPVNDVGHDPGPEVALNVSQPPLTEAGMRKNLTRSRTYAGTYPGY